MNDNTPVLILVDLQYDFMPGGALGVDEGDQVIDVANRLIPLFQHVVATKDWHPPDHRSFASQHPGSKIGDIIALNQQPQVLWPDHCLQDTPGAALVEELDRDAIHHVITKGTNPFIDSYSGFFDNDHKHATGLADHLRNQSASTLTIMGLATDYCVKFTALDAVDLGFEVKVVVDGCRAVNLDPNDGSRALAAMSDRGIKLITSSDILPLR